MNGKLVIHQKPDQDVFSNRLVHPPFTFKINKFEVGALTAIGYTSGKEMVRSIQKTPAQATNIKRCIYYSGKAIQTGEPDIILVLQKLQMPMIR